MCLLAKYVESATPGHKFIAVLMILLFILIYVTNEIIVCE